MAAESEGTASSWSTLLGGLLCSRPASTKLMVRAAHLPGVLAQPYLTATRSASLQGNPRSCMKFWESLTDVNVETCCSNPRKNSSHQLGRQY